MTDQLSLNVNGDTKHLPKGSTVTDLLSRLDVAPGPCAIEVNQVVVPRSTHHQHTLHDGDDVEVVTFVGGG